MREPTNEEQRLMIVGGFETLEEYLQWMNTPLDPAILARLEQPDYEEEAIWESGIFGRDPDEEELDLEEEEDE